jgi:hypothetical protein
MRFDFTRLLSLLVGIILFGSSLLIPFPERLKGIFFSGVLFLK